MSDGKDERGFSGLSSLVSDVDETVGDSRRRKVQRGKSAARGRSKDEQQPDPRESTAKPRPAPPPQSEPEPEVVASGTSRTPTSGSSGAKWFWGLVGLGVLIWWFNVAQEDSRGPSPPSSLDFGPPIADPVVSRFGQETMDFDYVEIAIGEDVTGNLSVSDLELDGGERADIYYFGGSAGESVRIRMASDVIDSYVGLLAIEDDRAVDLGEDDDSGNGLDADLRAVLTVNGMYLILATTYEADDLGTYRLSLSRGSGPDSDMSSTVDDTDPAAR